jgi:hypothetical protein
MGWLITLGILSTAVFVASLFNFAIAQRQRQEVKIVHQDIMEFRTSLIKMVATRKRRF